MGYLDAAAVQGGLLGQLPDNRLLGAADYAGVQPGYAPDGQTNAGPLYAAYRTFLDGAKAMPGQYLQQHQDFLNGIDPNTGQPAVTFASRMNTLGHYLATNAGPQSLGGAMAPVEGAFGAGPIRAFEGLPQEISSADTSIKQIPALLKNGVYKGEPGMTNLDIGGGKYDLGTDHLAQSGVRNLVLDPYNRSAEHNAAVMDELAKQPAHTATAANVLNVIKEPEARAGVIQQAHDNIVPGGRAYFQIYEGNGTGAGAPTSKGYQNNLRTGAYLDEVRKVFPDAVKTGNTIIGTKPLPSAPVAGGGLLGGEQQ